MSFRSKLRPFKHQAASALESIWRLGFARSPTTRRWTTPGDQRVLVVAPHPDDEAIGCVGTVLRHVAGGDCVCIAIATDGSRSRSLAVRPERMAVLRREEATRAARLMEVDRLEWIGLPEGAWRPSQLAQMLVALIAQSRPDIVYAPSRIDFHPEHFKVAHALALALRGFLGIKVRVYQIQVPLNPALVNLVTDVSADRSQCDAY